MNGTITLGGTYKVTRYVVAPAQDSITKVETEQVERRGLKVYGKTFYATRHALVYAEYENRIRPY